MDRGDHELLDGLGFIEIGQGSSELEWRAGEWEGVPWSEVKWCLAPFHRPLAVFGPVVWEVFAVVVVVVRVFRRSS